MKHEHYVLLCYIEETGEAVQIQGVPDDIAAVFCSQSKTVTLQAALNKLHSKKMILRSAPHTYRITAKGRKEVKKYKAFIEWQHKPCYRAHIPKVAPHNNNSKPYQLLAATLVLLGSVLLWFLFDR